MPKPSFLLTPLPDLARRLLAEGPVKILSASPRRVRVLFGGDFVVDTDRALRVWEHPYYPAYYLPLEGFKGGVLEYEADGKESFAQAILRNNGRSTDRVLVFLPNSEQGRMGVSSDEVTPRPRGQVLAGLVRIEFKAVDAWLEEDERIYVHPKDPFKRVDIVHSSRRVVVSVHGVKVADTVGSGGCWHLYETGLPVRFYLPVTAVLDWKSLTDSADETRTECPYKGVAEYYDLVLPAIEGEGSDGGGKRESVLKDIVWYYRNPTVECAAITGALCFYNEKVDIELDGKKLERPKTPFS